MRKILVYYFSWMFSIMFEFLELEHIEDDAESYYWAVC